MARVLISGKESFLDTALYTNSVAVKEIPVAEHEGMREATQLYYRNYKTFLARLVRRGRRLLQILE